MTKNLLYTALGLMGLMGTLAIGIVNAETTITHYTGSNISYTLNGNELFTGVGTITITDGTDTITILDRNLGAKKAGTGCEDPNWGDACAGGDDTYGYHFQRGNNYGFDPLDTSIKENAKSVSSDGAEWDDSGSYNNSGYYGSTFIKGDSSHGNDYWKDSTSSSSNHENLRGGGGDYNDASNGFGKNNENRRGPCPEGFHVPSYGELQILQFMLSADGKRNTDTLRDKLLIPFAGLRRYYDASVYDMGDLAYLWSSSPASASDTYSRDLYLDVDGYLDVRGDGRAKALSVRCFYDSYQPFTQGAEDGMNGITKTPGNITYTDTNGRVFTGIGTITITDGEKSITMLDRNLGATSTDITSTDSYGYHFQWGNNYGFTRVENESDAFSGSGTLVDGNTEGYADTSNNAWNNPYVSGAFIMDPNWDNGGWDKPYNHDLRGGANDYDNGWGDSSADYKRQGPCPAGYHVPSQKELDDLLQMYYALNPSGTLGGSDYGHYVNNQTFSTNFREAFKMPFAGFRDLADGKVYGMGVYAYLWSSSAYDDSYPSSRYLSLGAYDVSADGNDFRGNAQSVRCLLDSPLDDSGAKPLTLEYETDGGSAIQSQTIPAGGNAYLPGYTTHKDGANFLGWYNENGTEQYDLEIGTLDSNFIMLADMADENGVVKVYAKWGYNVTFVDWNGSGLKVEPVEAGGSATAPEVPERDGYTFSGWDTDFTNVTQDITVTAQYNLKDYTITYELYSGSNSSNNPGSYTIDSDEIIFKDATKEGYSFSGWYLDTEFTTKIEKIPAHSTGDKKLYAKRIANKYTITFVDGSGENENVVYSGAYESIINTQYPSWTKNGYTISWDKDIPSTMPLNGDTITASWTENKKPSGGSSGGGDRSNKTSDTQDSTTQNDKNTENVIQSETKGSEESSTTPMDSSDKSSEGQEILSPSDNSFTKEQKDAYEFAKGKGITTMPTIQKADMDGKLTRIAMAKMLSQYAINVLGQKPANIVTPKFKDVTDKQNSDYDDGVTLAYQLGIMGLNMPDNKFRPNDEVTRAEFATALSRMIYNTSDGEFKSTPKYYIHHIEKLVKEGIITNDDPNMKELRGYVMIMLMRSAGK